MARKKGLLVVFEGTDSSGKATQARLLADRLRAEGRGVELAGFPRYDSRFGILVGKYLAGDFGAKEDLSPYAVALLYAMDRLDFLARLDEWLSAGRVVVLDRYKASNLAHQSARFSKTSEQERFISWMELVESPLPEADLTFFLEMPEAAAQKLMEGIDRTAAYRGSQKRDQHESDLPYLRRTREIYKRLAARKKWVWISCVATGRIKAREEVAGEVWAALLPRLNP
jgi:dTMP kinase